MDLFDRAAVKAKIHNVMAPIKNKILVLSGKGGVGKSTVAVHLSVALADRGLTVGLLDVDLHGPSIPRMLGLADRRAAVKEGALIPIDHGPHLKVFSIPFVLAEKDAAVIWRGPRKGGAIRQLLSDVHWGPLDYLIIDAPPGTGDEPLSIAQTIPGVKALVVTTPQVVSVEDVRRSLTFLNKVNLPILGIVENMSGLICPHCHQEIALFKKGGGEALAREWGVPFLGRIPLEPELVAEADSGRPYFKGHETTAAAQAFKQIAETIYQQSNRS
jgi:ATP-binding protein involved in chromosome partitioning